MFDKKKNRCISCTDKLTEINFHSIFDTLKPAVELIFDSSDSIFLSFNKSLTSLAVIIWSKHLNIRLSGMKMRCISYPCTAYLHSIIYSIYRISYIVCHIISYTVHVTYTVHVYMRCCNMSYYMYSWSQTIALTDKRYLVREPTNLIWYGHKMVYLKGLQLKCVLWKYQQY